MVNRMVLNNVGYRPVRTALSVIAVAVEVLLIICVVGLVHGLIDEGAQRQRGLGADIIVQPPGSSNILGLTGAPMPEKIGSAILAPVPGVAAVTPVFWQGFGGLTLAYGIDVPSWDAVTGGLRILQGRMFHPGSYEMVVDDIYAQDNKLKVGDEKVVWGQKFTLAGIADHGKGARIFVPLRIVQQLLGSEGKASVFYVKLKDQQDMGPVLAAFKQKLEGYPVRSMSELTSLMTSGNIPGVKEFERIMIAIAVIIGFLVIFLAMYTTVLERTREIGTLKALGASKGYIINVILRETALIALIGIVVGVAASLVLRHFVLAAFPTLSIEITRGWLVRAAMIAVVGALLGASYPALRAARQDPIEALAYE